MACASPHFLTPSGGDTAKKETAILPVDLLHLDRVASLEQKICRRHNSSPKMELLSMIVFVLLWPVAQAKYISETCSTIRLLSVVPRPDNDTFAGWDRGFELIPAGHLATKHINQIPDILPGYQLEVIDVFSESCGTITSHDGLAEVYSWLVPPRDACVFGVVGLHCSTLTNLIAPIVDHPNFGHLVIAASILPAHRNTSALPHTFHTIASSSILNEAVNALMDEFKWKKISAVYDALGFFFTSTIEDFVHLMNATGKTITAEIPILPHRRSISDTYDTLNAEEARVGYFSITGNEAAAFLCEAYTRRSFWPDYVYIFSEYSFPQIISTPVGCSQEEMVKALEGVFLLLYRLIPSDQSADLVSRMSYEQYHSQYVEELSKFAQETGIALMDNVYANSLYDQVWAFALAANKSLGKVAFYNSSMTTPARNVEEMLRTRDILAKEMKDIEFQGASGFIEFGRNQEVLTIVDIFQVRNGEQVLVGYYDPFNRSIEFLPSLHKKMVPGDSFELHYKLVPIWVGSLVAFIDVLIFSLISFITFNLIFRRNAPEIKSSSLPLSLVMLVGCCSLCISIMVNSIRVVVQITNPSIFTVLCNLDLWLFLNGANIIIVTLAVRLLRIFHVFRSYRSTGKQWSDKYLVMYIIFICLAMVIFLILWTTLDPLRLSENRRYDPSATPPHYTVHNSCSSKDLGTWVALSLCLIGLPMILVIILAIQTRHIKRKDFKDTKKVNAFIFSACVVCAIFLPMWIILFAIGSGTGSFVSYCIVQLSGAVLCQVLLFLPKITPNLRRKQTTKRSLKIKLSKTTSSSLASIPSLQRKLGHETIRGSSKMELAKPKSSSLAFRAFRESGNVKPSGTCCQRPSPAI